MTNLTQAMLINDAESWRVYTQFVLVADLNIKLETDQDSRKFTMAFK